MSGAPCPSSPATSIAELCWSPAATRDAFLGFLVPPGLLDHCGLGPPGRWREDGTGDFRWFPAADDGILRIEVWPQPGGGDPTLALELADTRNGHVEAGWIVLNDLAGPRYHLDRDRDGTALARSLRARPAMAGVPIIAVTGAFDSQVTARVYDAGIDLLLAKPFRPDHVVGEVRRLLESGAVAAMAESQP